MEVEGYIRVSCANPPEVAIYDGGTNAFDDHHPLISTAMAVIGFAGRTP
jgi:hypothetical protein